MKAGVVCCWIFLALALSACATQRQEPSYAQQVLGRPLPANENDRMRECAWIRSEIARQQGLAGYGVSLASTPQQAVLYRAIAQQNIAALESRAANVRCYAAFSNAPAPTLERAGSVDFDQCFARCQKYTDRSKDQCFDACNK